jgi:RAB protein geranylgeranyltransferase component A
MKTLTVRQLKNKFKKIYFEEFDDPNESFMDFLLDLIPKEILIDVIEKGDKYYYSLFHKYK